MVMEAKKVFLKVSTRPKMACTISWYNELRALSPFFSLPYAGDHTVEKRGRGAEEHVPSGCHRLPEVWRLRRLGERTGASGEGGERLEAPPPPPPLSSLQTPECPSKSSSVQHLAKQLFLPVGMKKGGPHAVTQCVNWNSVHEALGVASGCWSRFFFPFLFTLIWLLTCLAVLKSFVYMFFAMSFLLFW